MQALSVQQLTQKNIVCEVITVRLVPLSIPPPLLF
jgi:hypothetical protein